MEFSKEPTVVKIVPDGSRVTVTVQATTLDAVENMAARVLAVSQGPQFGLSRAGISNMGGAYPVDINGEMSDDVQTGKVPVAGFRADHVIAGML